MSFNQQEPRLDTLQRNELAEGVEIHLRIAGPYVRVLAFLMDFFFRMAVGFAFYLLIMLSGTIIGFRVSQGLTMLLMFFLIFFYHIVFEAGKKGATPGKRMMGIRVVDTAGVPITYSQAFIRNMLRFADGMPLFYGFGLLTTLLTKRFQRLGDLLANTVVVYDRLPNTHIKPLPPAMESYVSGVSFSREEQAAILGFQERGGMWSEARRMELSDYLSCVTDATQEEGVKRLQGMANWLGGKG